MSGLLLMIAARKLPATIRKHILEEGFIDKAISTTDITGTPMEYLFDVYEEFMDVTGEHDSWTCFKCRDHILTEWKKLKPYLEQLQNEAIQI